MSSYSLVAQMRREGEKKGSILYELGGTPPTVPKSGSPLLLTPGPLFSGGKLLFEAAPPQVVAPIQTLLPQQVPTAHTSPLAQSTLVTHSASPAHGVEPSTQKPVPSKVLAQTQEPPGPQGPKLAQVWAVQVEEEQAPFTQVPEGHCREEKRMSEGRWNYGEKTILQRGGGREKKQDLPGGVGVTVAVTTGADTVVVTWVIPAQEQALLYLTAPEQALA
ncbi:MAG: hypothetical protein M1813_007898 [Trichoglossum hirsutum]|nr:MAG: hypothetical protein M1813_007898 [Trichoglossum hirsutum]